jgi:hypothetical protein
MQQVCMHAHTQSSTVFMPSHASSMAITWWPLPSMCTDHQASAKLSNAAAALPQSVYTPDVRLYHRAVVVAQEAPLRGLVRQLSIDQLDNEGRRVSIYENRGERTPLFTRSMSASVSGGAGLGWAAGGAVLEGAAGAVMPVIG